MKKTLILVSLALASSAALADIAVSFGHHTMGSDGFPVIGKGEQASFFWCVSKAGSVSATDLSNCSLLLCKKAFPKKGSCSADGWAMRKGHAIILVGPKGDNGFIASKAIGDPTRAVAAGFVAQNKFPVSKATVVMDKFEDGASDYTGRFVGSGPSMTPKPVEKPGLGRLR